MNFLTENIPISSKPTALPLILGSSSKNRQTILNLANWAHTVLVPNIDEKEIRDDDPYLLPVLIAKAKAAAILMRLDLTGEPFVLLTSDQIVLFGSEIREKPIDETEAFRFLSSYSNQEVSTISAVVATHYPSGKQASEVVKATIYFREISPDTIMNVIRRGEIYTSAGGFRIEDEDLNPLVKHIDGTVDSVLGMPLDASVRIIQAVTLDC